MITLDETQEFYVYKGNRYPRISRIFQETGVVDTRWFSDFHAMRGTHVHKAAELYVRGTLDRSSVDKECDPFFKGFELFMKEVDPKIVCNELSLVHTTLGFGCRLDFVVMIGDIMGVLDIKCTKVLPKHIGMQTMAHLLAFNSSMPIGPRIVKRWGLLLPGDDKYKLVPLTKAQDLTDLLKTIKQYRQGVNDDKRN